MVSDLSKFPENQFCLPRGPLKCLNLLFLTKAQFVSDKAQLKRLIFSYDLSTRSKSLVISIELKIQINESVITKQIHLALAVRAFS